jgi:hypothetical protein
MIPPRSEYTLHPWTIRQVIAGAYRTYFKHFKDLTAAVLIIPLLWAIPLELLTRHWAGHGLLGLEAEHPVHALLVTLIGAVWGSVWYAGQFTVALDAVRGRPIRWRAFITGLSRTPTLAAASIFISLPLMAIDLVPSDESLASTLVLLVAICVLVWLLARTAFWWPLLIDTELSFRTSFAVTWDATHQQTFRLIGLGALVFVMVLPLIVAETVAREQPFISFQVWGAVFVMAEAQWYATAMRFPKPV